MKTHFDPYIEPDEHFDEKAWCGTLLGERYEVAGNWKEVTCKRCLKSKDRIQKEYEEIEKSIVEEMSIMVKFFEEEKNNTLTKS